jgi:type II secretory pathway component PulF
MAVTGFGVIAFIFYFVIPSITKLFLEMNRQLPLPTVILIDISDFLTDYWMAIAISIIAAAIAIKFYSKTPNGRKQFDTVKLKLPLFGPMNTKIALARFSRTLAILLSSGLSIVETLDLAKNVIGNTIIAAAAENAKNAITRGISIADSFKQTEVFPPVVIHMIDAGEKSGSIEEGLTIIAQAYDSDVEAMTKALTSMLEPAMIVIFGLITGFIVLAVLLPIFDINQAIT